MSTSTVSANSRIEPAVRPAWEGFVTGPWVDRIDVRDFIQRNYTPYVDDASFLAGPTARTTGIWAKLTEMFPAERASGVYDIDQHTPVDDHLARARLHRPPPRDHRRPADGRAR